MRVEEGMMTTLRLRGEEEEEDERREREESGHLPLSLSASLACHALRLQTRNERRK